MLNISRIEMGRLRIDPQPTDVDAVIAANIREVQPLAQEKKVVMRYEKNDALLKLPVILS